MLSSTLSDGDGSGRRRSLRFHLTVVVVVAVLPVIAAVTVAVWQAGTAFRQTSEARLSEIAGTLATVVEANLDATISALGAITHQSTETEDGAMRPAALAEAGRLLGGELHVFDPHDPNETEALDTEIVSVARRAVGDALPTLSNLVRPELGVESRLVLAIPFDAGTDELKALIFIAPPERLIQLLRQRDPQLEGMLVAVTDGSGRLIARSRGGEQFIGKPVPDWAKLQSLGVPAGQFDARTAEGGNVRFSFRTLARTPGWVVVVGEPLEVFNSRWQQPLIALAVGVVLALLAALVGVIRVSGGILGPIGALAAYGRNVAASDSAPAGQALPASHVREFEILRRSFIDAEQALRNRAEREREAAETLAASERRYRTVAQAGAMVFWRATAEGNLTEATGWEEFTGREEAEVLGQGWTEHIHEHDLPDVERAWRRSLEATAPLDIEFRVMARGQRWNWVRARAAALRGPDAAVVEWAGSLEDVDARRAAQARVAHMAHHDFLTGLGNRVLMTRSLEQAIERARAGHPGALLLIDLDRFKAVNDTHGHQVGDRLLCAVAKRLRDCCGRGDVGIRMGGDEFAVIQDETGQPDAATALAGRIVERLSAPYRLAGLSVSIGASVGVAIVGSDPVDAAVLLRQADSALYAAKRGGCECYVLFGQGVDVRARRSVARGRKPATVA